MRSLFSRIFGHKCSFSVATKMEVEVHYPFVGLLSNGDKKRFYQKLCDLMKTVRLHEKGVSLSRTDRMLIATPAAILTLGCKQLNWHRFRHIFVYPKAYKNKKTGSYHYGETSSVGSIVLSWKRVKEGIDDPDDALHLLYHEYAHALLLIRSQYSTREDREFVDLLNDEMEDLMISSEIVNSPILRKYAFTNYHEFFACVTEEMMERADVLRDHHPRLYHLFLRLLKLEKWEDLLLRHAAWYR